MRWRISLSTCRSPPSISSRARFAVERHAWRTQRASRGTMLCTDTVRAATTSSFSALLICSWRMRNRLR